MHIRIITIFILAFFMINTQLKAQQLMSLESILTDIDANHPELKMYEAKAHAFDTYSKGAKSWDAPQISAGLWMTPYNAKLWSPDANSYIAPIGLGQFMISGTQMIPNFKRLDANQNYMQGMSSVEKANRGFTKNMLFYEAKMNYYEWMVLKKRLFVLKENEALINFIVKTTESRYPYNQEKLSSIYKAKAMVLEINNEQIMAENEIEQKKVAINTLLNRDKNMEFDIDTAYTMQNYEVVGNDTSLIASNRSDVQALEQSIKVSRFKQKLEMSKGGMSYGIRIDHMQGFGYQPNLFTIMAMINIPMAPWAAKEYKAQAAGISYEVTAMEKQKEAIINQSSGLLRSVAKQIANKKRQVKLYQTGIIPALQKNYNTTLLAFQQNTEELFTVLDARQNLQSTQLEYLNQLQELLLLQVKYEKEIERQ
jgi:cobalt-zinc-cadmium efflux system outer membrane protein